MSRCIDVDSTVKEFNRLAEDMSINDRAVVLLLALELNDEKRFPTVDAVPVVRCVDCRFSSNDGEYCEYHRNPTIQAAFCSAGRKRA